MEISEGTQWDNQLSHRLYSQTPPIKGRVGHKLGYAHKRISQYTRECCAKPQRPRPDATAG